ncbi:MAG: L-histidine N(alpha)-methyltransferase, partial [Actinobacteria bacterium]|nr:L-histidine N(alpha)-methyltransferase [Actinomycetota bacterium]
PVCLEEGEEILTEISAKFTAEQVSDELVAAGFVPLDTWRDANGDFQLTLAAPSVLPRRMGQ